MESVLTLYLNSHIDILIFIAKPHECNLSINKDKTIYKFFGRSFISVAKKCYEYSTMFLLWSARQCCELKIMLISTLIPRQDPVEIA